LIRPAREGTLRVLRAAARSGVHRVVMTSSGGAISYGRGSRSTPFTEDDWSVPDPSDTSAYERSKLEAERAAWAWTAANPASAELVTICPGAVIGPAIGRQLSTSSQIITKLIDGSLPGLPRIGFPLVDVRDVADLHVRAMTAEVAAGQRYIGAGPFLWMSEIADIIRKEFTCMPCCVRWTKSTFHIRRLTTRSSERPSAVAELEGR
jgi:dihydroflavonol-4-reductase